MAGIPVTERRLPLAGIPTAVLEGGDGPPVVLLHGAGEFAARWLRVIPDLMTTHRVVAPDLPGHGASGLPDDPLDADRVLAWLGELIERTCPSPPALVGHLLGGAIAARFASDHGDRLGRLVLVDALGLSRFRAGAEVRARPARLPARRPNTRTTPLAALLVDLDGLREQLGDALGAARDLRPGPGPHAGHQGRPPRPHAAVRAARDPAGGPRPDRRPHDADLGAARPQVRLRVAQAANARYGWPLHVIDGAADDPAAEQPAAFLAALRQEPR